MKYIYIIIIALTLFTASAYIATANGVKTTVTVVISCNNANYQDSPRCNAPVDWFLGNTTDGFYGALTSGVTFRQGPILTDRDVLLHKMIVEDAYWYIDQQGPFWAASDVAALSIHLTRINN